MNNENLKPQANNKLRALLMMLFTIIMGVVYQQNGFSLLSIEGNININRNKENSVNNLTDSNNNSMELEKGIENALKLENPIKQGVFEFYANYGKCPQSFEDIDLKARSFRNVNVIKSVSISSDGDKCTIHTNLRSINKKTKFLDNKQFKYSFDIKKTQELGYINIWMCSSDTLSDYLPDSCKYL